jgi:ribonucleoside-diphosphate reductase alpha chain
MNTDDTVASTLTPPTDTPVDAAPGSDTLWITKEGGN